MPYMVYLVEMDFRKPPKGFRYSEGGWQVNRALMLPEIRTLLTKNGGNAYKTLNSMTDDKGRPYVWRVLSPVMIVKTLDDYAAWKLRSTAPDKYTAVRVFGDVVDLWDKVVDYLDPMDPIEGGVK